MSGTSLDGIDLAHLTFQKTDKWHFQLEKSTTIPYPKSWKNKLQSLASQDSYTIQKTNLSYGAYLGKHIHNFIHKNQLKVDFIASHGHTIFHQPENGYTLQIGDGQTIANSSKQTVICDFRSLDVSLGGQGAPLVPIGDQLLFSDYDYCLNLGGFSNISFLKEGKRIAFDIGPVNIVLNDLAQKLGKPYDKDGAFAQSGRCIPKLLEQLNSLDYYKQNPPKSLGKEWVEQHINPILEKYPNITDLLHTFSEHAAIQIGKTLQKGECLITGGGTFNAFLIERIGFHSKSQLHIPHKDIINYKEALIFAFLGVLRHRNETNCLSSVTGAKRDSSSGLIFKPKQSS